MTRDEWHDYQTDRDRKIRLEEAQLARRDIRFHVPGTPRPQGSKRHVGHGRMIESSKQLPEWRSRVALSALAANRAYDGSPIPRGTPIRVDVTFTFQRPKGHYGTGRNAARLKPSAPTQHTVKPDIDKLERAILDALTGVLWVDDSQVVAVTKHKRYGIDAGATITVTPFPEGDPK